ncbi:MAG: EVE domain-containing protein [Candidatus Bathyarchaeota archaeon]|nr:EVE domain-containing protein [Candidatus Bathyarchaeota archaeon]
MREKDIENLLVKYPDEFLPGYGLTVKGQQVRLGAYSADIVFEDRNGNNVIAEIKRGILTREGLGSYALGQAMEYYGLLKKKEPNKKIRLMLIANVIPKSMTAFLSDMKGVEFTQISDYKINEVARKYNYQFSDSKNSEQICQDKLTIEKMNYELKSAQHRIWIFQANPQRYDILNALVDESINEDVWEVNQHKKEIHMGDLGIIWMSGNKGGIYGFFDITSNPEMLKDSEESTKYWVNESEKRQVKLRVKNKIKLKLINNPIRKEELKNIPELQNMTIFKMPRGTNFKVTDSEWQAILTLLKSRE